MVNRIYFSQIWICFLKYEPSQRLNGMSPFPNRHLKGILQIKESDFSLPAEYHTHKQ